MFIAFQNIYLGINAPFLLNKPIFKTGMPKVLINHSLKIGLT